MSIMGKRYSPIRKTLMTGFKEKNTYYARKLKSGKDII